MKHMMLAGLALSGLLSAPGSVDAQTNWNQIHQQNAQHQQRMEQQHRQGEMNRLGYEQQQRQQQQSQQYWNNHWAAVEAERRRQVALGNDDVNRSNDWWGTVAVHLPSGRWFWSVNHRDARQAYAQVTEGCPEGNCALLAMFRNTCVAAAEDAEGLLFWADHEKKNLAASHAADKCRQSSSSPASCSTPKNLIACSGYAYSDWDGKLSKFNRAGLIGVVAPKMAGIPDLAAAETIYNPALVMLTAQPTHLRDEEALASVQAMGEGRPKPLWGAIALSKAGGMGMGMGLTEAIAKSDALKKCTTGECEVVTSFEGDICLSFGSGRNADGQNYLFVNALKDKAEAESVTLAECKAHGNANCRIESTDCVRTSSLKEPTH